MNAKIFLCVLIVSLFILDPAVSPAPHAAEVSGTEEPQDYGPEKQRILEKQQRMRRSELIQKTARLYRQMVASYKAKRISHAESVSAELTDILDDPLLPEKFADKIRRKQDAFLTRVYETHADHYLDLKTDEMSDRELAEVREEIDPSEYAQAEKNNKPSDAEIRRRRAQQREDARAEKKRLRQERAAEKKRQREEAIARKKAKREDRLAEKNTRRQEAQARREMLRTEKEQNKNKANDNSASSDPEQDLIAMNRSAATEQDALNQQLDKIGQDNPDDKLFQLQREAYTVRQKRVDGFIDEYRRHLRKTASEKEQELSRRIESLYHDALEFYRANAYRLSYDLLSEIEKIQPDYKLTRRYLKDLRERLGDYAAPLQNDRETAIQNALDQAQAKMQ